MSLEDMKQKLNDSPTFKKGLMLLGLFVIGVAVGRYTLPAKIVIKTETKTIEKLVEDINKKENSNKVIKIVEKTEKDGTVTKTTEIVDKSTTDTNTKIVKDTDSSSKTEKTTTYAKNDWHFAALAGTGLFDKGLSQSVVYGIGVQKRLIGPFYVGAFGFSNKFAGASLGMSF